IHHDHPPRDQAIVLVIDDDRPLLRLLDLLLTDEGYEATCATDGAAGLDALEECDPCLIVLDLNMPVMDGYEFLEAARARGCSAPVLIVTAGRARRSALNGERVMPKPFDLDEFTATVKQLAPLMSNGRAAAD